MDQPTRRRSRQVAPQPEPQFKAGEPKEREAGGADKHEYKNVTGTHRKPLPSGGQMIITDGWPQ